jgi:hypothetical protein
MSNKKNSPTNALVQLEDTLEPYFTTKAPFQLPDNVKELIVQYGPWLSLISLIFVIPLAFAALGLTAIFSPLSVLGGVDSAYSTGWGMVLGLVLCVMIVLQAMAIPKLMKRQIDGWRLLFYVTTINVAHSVLGFDIFGALISALVGYFFLFQVKHKYK